MNKIATIVSYDGFYRSAFRRACLKNHKRFLYHISYRSPSTKYSCMTENTMILRLLMKNMALFQQSAYLPCLLLMKALSACARLSMFSLSRLVVGSSRVIMPQLSQNVSAKASLMSRAARTRCPALLCCLMSIITPGRSWTYQIQSCPD